MRYSASDKTEIIRLVEQSPWPARRALGKLAFPDRRFTAGMIDISAADQRPSRIALHGQIGFGTGSRRLSVVRLSTWRWTLTRNSASRETGGALHGRGKNTLFSEASIYRLLKAHDLIITSPAYIVIKAAEEFKG